MLICIGIPGNSECVRLMIAEGALMEAHDCHFGTPLHVACARQHLDCVKILLNAGKHFALRVRDCAGGMIYFGE